MGVRRLQKAGDLSGREDHAPGRTVKAGGEAAVEAAPPQGAVGAEEDDVADPEAGWPQVVVTGEGLEGGKQAAHRFLRLRLLGRLAAEEDLRLEQRPGIPQLRVECLADEAALEKLAGIGGAAAPFVVQHLHEAAPLAMQPSSLPFQAALQSRAARTGARQ